MKSWRDRSDQDWIYQMYALRIKRADVLKIDLAYSIGDFCGIAC